MSEPDPADTVPLPAAPDEAPASRSLDESLATLRHHTIERILQDGALIALVGGPSSALRSLQTGWLPLYSIHLSLAAFVLVLYAFRRRVADRVKAALVMAVFAAVGLSGLIALGPMGAGNWWLVVCALLLAVLYSVRHGVAMIAFGLVALAVTGVAYCMGWLSLPMDADEYVRNPMTWVNLAIGTTLMPMVIFGAVAGLHATTTELLKRVDEQRQRIEFLASHDPLTGLPTMTLGYDRLRQALLAAKRDHRPVAVFYVDLDEFKHVNDTYGHAAGDHVLQVSARRMRACVRAADTVARLGGDEFLVVQSGFRNRDEADATLARLRQALSEPIDIGPQRVAHGASIGMVMAPADGEQAEQLVRAADAAMYVHKRKRQGDRHA